MYGGSHRLSSLASSPLVLFVGAVGIRSEVGREGGDWGVARREVMV